MDRELLTRVEAAAYLRVHPRTVGRLLRAGSLPGVKVGRQWRLRKADLDAYRAGGAGRGGGGPTIVGPTPAHPPVHDRAAARSAAKGGNDEGIVGGRSPEKPCSAR